MEGTKQIGCRGVGTWEPVPLREHGVSRDDTVGSGRWISDLRSLFRQPRLRRRRRQWGAQGLRAIGRPGNFLQVPQGTPRESRVVRADGDVKNIMAENRNASERR